MVQVNDIQGDKLVKEIRQKLGLTQKGLAEMLGVSENTVQNWEYGKPIPKTKHQKLRELAKTRIHQFAGGGEQVNTHGDNINGNNVTVNKTDAEKMLDLLASKEDSLHKSQEQIDRLIAMLEKLTNKLTEQ